MRFVIGLVTGTVLTLLVATAVDAPTRPILKKAEDALEDSWNRLIEHTSDSLFPATEVPPAGKPALATPMKAEEPALALPPPAEAPPPTPVRALPPQRDTGTKGVENSAATVDRLATTDVDPSAALEPDPPDLRGDVEETDTETASAWAPFHSQMSAEGFAARLTRALDHDFRVERRAPGSYQVVFDAASPDERELLLAEIAEVTGQ
jgi:hypothetical protein